MNTSQSTPYRQMENSIDHASRVLEVEADKVGMADAPAKQYLVRKSKRLPWWLWISIAYALGIRIRPNDRAILANLLYISTIVSALVLVTSTSTYVIADVVQTRVDIKSNQTHPTGGVEVGGTTASSSTSSSSRITTHADVMDGIAMVSLTVFWCLLGLYSKNLAYRLYNSSKFLDMVRLHAKTILKINAAFVFFLLMTTFVTVHNVQAYYTWYADRATCLSAGVSPLLCQIRFIALCVFSVFAILWNSLVGIVLLSVCRTNTMGIRGFIQDLERDANIYERQRFGPNAPLNDLMWLTENDADLSSDGDTEPSKLRRRYTNSFNNNESPQNPTATQPISLEKSPVTLTVPSINEPQRTTLEMNNVSPSSNFRTPMNNGVKEHAQPMSTAVVLQRYWRLSCATRISSLTFQRWTTCVTTLCLAWVAMGLVQWLSITPRPLQVAQVCIPLMILPLLCAAYAEVNVEGKRLLKCICPMEQRLAALYVMWQSPPQMTVFGVTITYGAMGTAAVGLLIALASRVVLKQLGAGNS